MGFYELAEKALALEKAGKKVVRLNIGDTNLPTPQAAVDAGARRMNEGKSGYGPSAGLPELRERIAEREGCGVENVVVGPGSKHLIYGLMSVLCKKGDGVAFPSPHWPMYALASAQLGLRAKMARTRLEDGWGLTAPALAGAKLAIICNPLNPTSTIYDERTIRGVMDAAAGSGTHVILDEAYKGLAFMPVPEYEGAIRVRSFSKEFNMEGWRLGYAVAPKETADRLIAYNHITATCVAPFVQAAGLACLEHEKEILGANVPVWKARAEAASRALRRAGFRFALPEAGIYVFATHPGLVDSEAFAMELLQKKGVCVAPGSGFGDYKGFVRICVNRDEAELAAAIEAMGCLLDK
ncbi:MAG: pyridoxal phosphate-dependent aminotransferase [Candidatus Micrarchaeota archaeon]